MTRFKEIDQVHLFLMGLAFTGLNPHFILWWLTVGANLIVQSLEFTPPLAGTLFMYLSHIWMDYAWLTLVAYFAERGTNIVNFRGYKISIAVFGTILIYFGVRFLIDSLSF